MFDFIKNIFSEKAGQHISSANNNTDNFDISEPQLLLLTEFVALKSKSKIKSDWEKLLGEPPEKTITRLISNGLLVQGELDVMLSSTYSVVALKSFLKERGLPVSGKKESLIQRLISSQPEGIQALVNDIYECSEVANDLIEKYKSDKELKKIKRSMKFWPIFELRV